MTVREALEAKAKEVAEQCRIAFEAKVRLWDAEWAIAGLVGNCIDLDDAFDFLKLVVPRFRPVAAEEMIDIIRIALEDDLDTEAEFDLAPPPNSPGA